MKLHLAILAVLSLLIVACAQSPTAQTPSDQPAAAQENQPTAAPSPEPSSGKLDAVATKVQSLLSGQSNLQWKIDYDLTSEITGHTISSQMTQYLKGTSKIRSDVKMSGVESRAYIIDGALTSCNNIDGSWSCQKLDMKTDETKKVENGIKSHPQDYVIVADGSMTVAGQSTSCYKITTLNTSVTVRYCFTSDGVPLYVKSVYAQGSTEMKAISFTKSVSDSDFVLPAEPSAAAAPGAGMDRCAACSYLSGEQKSACLDACK